MSEQTNKQQVPQDLQTRCAVRDAARRLVVAVNLLPPQSLENLQRHASELLADLNLHGQNYDDYAMIWLNNAVWERHFPAIPRNKRLLLLPFCLRNHDECSAPRDDLGLICQECGKCRIPAISAQADALEMPVLVAESSSRVAEWVEAGEIEAVVGVSCLNSLEKAFPAMLRHAVPGLAVPLLRDGCKDTEYDESFLADAMQLPEDGSFALVSIPDLQKQMTELFTEEIVSSYLRFDKDLKTFSKEIVHSLCAHGKHYRPLISYAVYSTLSRSHEYPDFLRVAALAVECFHKASLIHDDIEDNDSERYGEPTMHQRIGMPVALNAGDFLVGEGYRLFCHESIPKNMMVEMVDQAAQAHCELALGQAREFELSQSAVTLEMCLETYRLKTSPAFRVAMNIGAIAAGKFNEYRDFFQRFADLMGVSYQLYDDLEDTEANPASAVDCLMLARGYSREDARRVIMDQYEQYRHKAFECLEELSNVPLKILLWRLMGKVLKDVQ